MPKRRKQSGKLNKWWLRYEYKHTTLAILAIVLFLLLVDSVLVAAVFGLLERLDYLGGFIAGLLSVSFFTAVPAVVLMVDVALHADLNPFVLAFVIATGSTVGDWLVLTFYEEKIFHELRPLFRKLGLHHVGRLFKTRYTSWILTILGAFIIISPLPDEVGVGLMGIAHFKRMAVVGVCFMLNLLGALVVVLAARTLSA